MIAYMMIGGTSIAAAAPAVGLGRMIFRRGWRILGLVVALCALVILAGVGYTLYSYIPTSYVDSAGPQQTFEVLPLRDLLLEKDLQEIRLVPGKDPRTAPTLEEGILDGAQVPSAATLDKIMYANSNPTWSERCRLNDMTTFCKVDEGWVIRRQTDREAQLALEDLLPPIQ